MEHTFTLDAVVVFLILQRQQISLPSVDYPKDGWIELFAIDRNHGNPQIVPTGKRIRMPRGVHDLAVTY